MEKLKRAHGNWVVGEKFWDREKEIELFIERIDEGAHIQLAAPRRIGKSSLMREVARRIEDRYICLQVDLQKSSTPAQAIVELSAATYPYQAIWGKTKEIFSNIFEEAKSNIDHLKYKDVEIVLSAGISAGDWKAKGDKLFAVLSESEKPVVVFFDEVTILINRMLKGGDYKITAERMRQTDEFMSWLRENSIKHKGKIRIVLTGSIGLEPILRQAHLSATINTFPAFELKPWNHDTAIGCLKALANQCGIGFEEGAMERMLDKLGCYIPHHVQMFFDHIYETCRHRDNMKCSLEDVENVYNESMLSTRGHAELTHYEERLKLVLGDEIFTLALDLLTQAAVKGHLTLEDSNIILSGYDFEGRDSKEILRQVLEIMEHDGYLKSDPKGWVFISYLLRDWWKNRHELNFIQASERKNKGRS